MSSAAQTGLLLRLREWIYLTLWLRLPERLRRRLDPDLRVSEWAVGLSEGEDKDGF